MERRVSPTLPARWFARATAIACAIAIALPLGIVHAEPARGRAPGPVPSRRGTRALVVLGAPVRADGSPSAALERRLAAAQRAARRDPTAIVIVTGGAVANRFAEGPAMRAWLVDHGVDAKRILVEDRARFTRENATRSVPLLRSAGATHVTVVTDRYHVRRGVTDMKLALRAAGMKDIGVDAVAAPDGVRDRRSVATAEAEKIARDRAMANSEMAATQRPLRTR